MERKMDGEPRKGEKRNDLSPKHRYPRSQWMESLGRRGEEMTCPQTQVPKEESMDGEPRKEGITAGLSPNTGT